MAGGCYTWVPGLGRVLNGCGLQLFARDTQNFGEGCHSITDLIPAVVSQRTHAELNREISDRTRVCPLHDDFAHFVRHREEFENAKPAEVACAVACIASDGLPDVLEHLAIGKFEIAILRIAR